MFILIIYLLVTLIVAILIKLNEEEFTAAFIEAGDDFTAKQLIYSALWPFALVLIIICSPYLILVGINEFIDKNKK